MKWKLFIYLIACLFGLASVYAQTLKSSQTMETVTKNEVIAESSEIETEDEMNVGIEFSGFTVLSGFGEDGNEGRILIASVTSSEVLEIDAEELQKEFETSNRKPETFSLSQNYPNPFNPTTNFGFRIANFGLVTLKIYNVLGQQVELILNREEIEAGEYQIRFDAGNLPGGVYYYRLLVESNIENGISPVFNEVKQMVLVK
ncbi:MAG: T9SS type A sorting domain-containing protein [Ignavibacteriae bacterium]|nr:T9SS type A sorting domain-containing protein [Ignavibacteriota bacterium]